MSINNKTKRAKKKKVKESKRKKTKNSKNSLEIEFICPLCKTREFIPRDIVEFLDEADSLGRDISIPPRFDCKYCNGLMEPIYYIGVMGHVYKYKD